MKRNKSLILFALLTLLFGCQQTTSQHKETLKNREYGFYMQEPKDWIVGDNKDIAKNINKFDFDDEKFKRMMQTEKGNILLKSYYKYNPKTTAGIIPTIIINLRKNDTKNFEQFKNSISKSAVSFKQYFSDFEFTEEPQEVEISGIRSVFFSGKFSLKKKDGEVLQAKNRTYAIPVEDYFYQVNFSDGQNGEDSTALFDELLKSIKITKSK
ncbi:MAG: hypothetical protein ACR2J3_11800 [Aridibacter sp.]